MTSHKVQQSGNSFYAYLPNQWVKDNKLTRGSKIHFDEHDNKITISPRKDEVISRKTVEIETAAPEVMNTYLMGLFMVGYDEIELKFKKPLDKESFNSIKELIKTLGFNMVDLTNESIKLSINLEVKDIKTFTKNQIYKALNIARLKINNGEQLMIDEQVNSIRNNRFIIIRSLYRHQQSQSELINFKPYEHNLYYTLAQLITHLGWNISKISNKIFIDETKKIIEQLLITYDKLESNSLFNILKKIEALNVTVTNNAQVYHKRRVYTSLRDIIRCMIHVSLLN